MSKYVCENCKKQIENEADSLIIDKVSGSGEVDGYLAICPECLKKIVPEAREECKSCLYYEICNAIGLVGIESAEIIKCVRYKDRSQFVELSHAEWVEDEDMYGDPIYRCSNCNEHFVLEEGTPTDNCYSYCPNCGAKMDEQALKERES